MNRRIKVFVGIIVMAICWGFSVKNVSAALTSEEVFTRILINHIDDCYDKAFVPSISVTSYFGFNSLMNDGFKESVEINNGFLIPNLTDSYNNMRGNDSNPATPGGNLTSCYALFNGYDHNIRGIGKMTGLFGIYNIGVPSNNSDVDKLSTFMHDRLGYTIKTENASSSQYCYTIYMEENVTSATKVKLGTYCRNKDNYPIKWNDTVSFSVEGNSDYTITSSVGVPEDSSSTKWNVKVTANNEECYDGSEGREKCYKGATVPIEVPTAGDRINMTAGSGIYWVKSPNFYIEITEEGASAETSRNVVYEKGTSSAVRKGITGSVSQIRFTDKDKYDFYMLYLQKKFGYSGVNSSTCKATKPSTLADTSSNTYYVYRYSGDDSGGWYEAHLNSNSVASSYPMTVFTSAERFELNKVINTLPELINLLGELNYPEANCEDPPDPDPTPTPTPGTIDSEVTCMNSGATETLGWILCPILQWLSSAADSLYDTYLEPSLKVEPKLFSGDGEYKNTETAWGNFRDIANTLFVILLIFVIFSQLTGYGIDNYGIKKILPKLIVAAVLINLSFIICQICIDISNIVGNGAREMFEGFSVDPPETIAGIDAGGLSGGTILGVGVLGLLAVEVWGTSMAMGTTMASALLLMLLMAAISIVVSIVFLFIILAARQASIVVLTVISPLAFACFILPNTKKLFDKWLRFGWSLLLVYPIAGILVGGGNFVSKLLLASQPNQLFMVLTAMIIGVVPIFFIPSVVKSSLAAAGNIGARIAGMGSRLSGRLSRDVGNFARTRDSFRRMDNFMGRHSLSMRTRAQAGQNEAALREEMRKRRQWGSRETMARTSAAAAAASEARDYDEATGQTLSLMESAGFAEGATGIVGTGASAREVALGGTPLNITNAEARLRQLAAGGSAANGGYTDNERNEMAALARYMASQKGGAGMLDNAIRSNSGNQNFAAAMGDIYRRDGAVQAKMKEKDQAVGVYMDRGNFGQSFTDMQRNDPSFAGEVNTRIKSHEVGLNQGGTAAREYISTLNQSQAQQIMDNDILLNSLDNDIRDAFMTHAATLGVTGKSATTVEVSGRRSTYADPSGQVHEIRKTADGRYIDNGGFEVDISKFRQT